VFYRSNNPSVKIGIILSTSSPTLDLSTENPFYLTITARIIKTPRSGIPISFSAYLNPFESIPNRSIKNIIRVFPPTEQGDKGKFIETWPRGWPNYNTGERDLKKKFDFITIYDKHDPLVIKHEVSRNKIERAGLQKGEKYKVALTDKALGTRWWTFGALGDYRGVEFREWCPESPENQYESSDECLDKDPKETAPFTIGEDPAQFALIVEKGEAEFEIV
jgi:hypothetical protein